MIDLAPFRARDYLEAWLACHGAGVSDPVATAEALERDTVGFTGRLDGRVLACAGITVQWEGLGLAWGLVTPLGRQHPLPVHRAVKNGLWRIVAAHSLRRVECAVALDFEVGRRWAEALGFEEESVVEDYLPSGGAAVKYALRVKR